MEPNSSERNLRRVLDCAPFQDDADYEAVLMTNGPKSFFVAISGRELARLMDGAVPVDQVVDYFSPLSPSQQGIGRLSFAAMFEFTTKPCRAYILLTGVLLARVKDMDGLDQERCRALLEQAETVSRDERARRAGIIRA